MRTSTSAHTSRAVALVALGLLVASCDSRPGPRRVPFPVFNARAPFPELSEAAPTPAGSDPQANSGSGFERAIARELGDAPAEGTPAARARSVQTVPLAGVLAAELPQAFDEWSWSTDGGVTLIAHRRPGESPDALIYVEAYSPAVERFPSYEVGRFLFTVEPGLSPNIVYPPLIPALAKGALKQTGVPMLQAIVPLELMTTRTRGRGLGFSAPREAFSGWRWIGDNEHHVALRLGRSSGVWGPQPAMDALSGNVLERLERAMPELKKTLETMKASASSPTTRHAPSPAWMLVGTAQRDPQSGVHIAILCERRPRCPVAQELSRMLTTLRPLDGSGAPPRESLVTFASGLGLSMLSARDVLTAPQLVKLVEQGNVAEAARRAGGATPGLPGGVPGLPNIPGLPGNGNGNGNGGGTPGSLPIPIPGLPGGGNPLTIPIPTPGQP